MPMRRAILDLVQYAGAALLPPLMAFILSGGRVSGRRMLHMFAISYVFALCIGFPMERGLHWLLPRMAGRPKWKVFGVIAMVLVFFAVVGTLVGALFICGVGLVAWREYFDLVRSAVQMSLLLTTLFGIGGIVTGHLQRRLEETNALLRKKEEEERRARELATEARLQSLESRVHPHFLFNAINSILSLMREDPRQAEDLLERMAALLRFSLDQSQRLVPLTKELKIVRDYLEIEKARFGDRLRFRVDLPDGLEGEVPPLAIQTLVENAVKYAVSPRREGGEIRVTAEERDGKLVVEVRDDGPGFDEAAVQPGHGIDLLRQRLDGWGELALEAREGGMAVRVALPVAVRA
jgi:signal transduction histidine kinase